MCQVIDASEFSWQCFSDSCKLIVVGHVVIAYSHWNNSATNGQDWCNLY